MKRCFFTGILLMICSVAPVSIAFAQKSGIYQSKRYTGLSPKDGTDYLNIMQYDDKSKFMYLVCNDDTNLYIDVILSDRAAIQKTMMYGLTTWIDPAAKRKKALGIEFPLPGGGIRDQGPQPGRGEGVDRKAMMALAMQEKNSRMKLKGFSGKGSEVEINPLTDPHFHGKVEMIEGEKLRVFLVVPLEQVESAGETAVSEPLSIGFETGYMDLNRSGMASGGSMQGGGERYHDGPPPGGSGPPSGIGGMDRSAGEQQEKQPNLNQLASPSRMWIKQIILTSDL